MIYALTVDRDTVALRFASENISRLLGFTVAETLSYDWWLSRLHPKDREVAAASVAETLSRGVSRTEYRVQHKDGTYRWIDDNRRLVLDATGVTELVGAWTDITERKELENQFLRAQRLESIGSLAGGIAHDLNNIFMPILMGVSTIKRLEHGERTRKAAETIEQCVRRGTDLVKQVLLFARGADGSRVDLDLGSVVAEVEAIAHSTFPGNVRFVTSVAADLPRFQGNPTQLMQVLLNLCVNARDALPAGGEIKVTAGVEQIDGSFAREHGGTGGGRYVVLEVIDDGTGMSPAILGRIFEPFFTTKLAGQGTGLGLSTSLGIVRGHRGFVTVSSEVGIGSSFKVYVPADAGSAETAAASVRSDQYLPRGSGELILVVEDETAVLDMTRQALEASGYEVFTAENGARALDVFERERPNIDLVITDMVMPVMDGATLIRQLRQIDSGVRIIATSGWDQTVQSANAMAGGAQRFLAKPFTAAVMLRTVFDVLRPSG